MKDRPITEEAEAEADPMEEETKGVTTIENPISSSEKTPPCSREIVLKQRSS